MNVVDLKVSDRIKTALKLHGVCTVEHICSLYEAELDRIPDLGKVGQKRLIQAVLSAGYPGPTKFYRGQCSGAAMSSDTRPQLKIRLDPDVLKRVRSAAKKNNRTLNGELAHRIAQSFNDDDLRGHMDAQARAIANEIKAALGVK